MLAWFKKTVREERRPSEQDQLVDAEIDQMWVDRDYRPALDQAGIGRFAEVMSTIDGRLLRALRDRENWRLELHDAHGAPRGAYLKRHHARSLAGIARAKLGLGPGLTAGRAEAHSLAQLSRGGIAAMKLIAFGEKLHADGLVESFVLTEELAGFTQLDHFLNRRFPPRAPDIAVPRDPALDTLVRAVADVAARFHGLGYNHRDLYCCHFFIREPSPGQFQVHMIDLQRVEHRRWWRHRWIVKDLAQLAYSATRTRITNTQRMAFLHRYLGVDRLTPAHKRLARRVLAKQRRMERSLGLHP